MRKEIPLFITALVGVVLILQYFSPNKSINSVESTFMDWAQIVFAFSMILGILNLIRVNGDKIYKKRKNWGLSVIIIISFFITAIVGFTNVGDKVMYDRKILKTNFLTVNQISEQVLKDSKIVPGKKYNSYLVALIEGTQKEKTISSLLPSNLKNSKEKYVEMLTKVRELSKKSITITNQIGRDLNNEIKLSLKKMRNKEFTSSILTTYDDINSIFEKANKKFSLEAKSTMDSNIKSQISYILSNPKVEYSVNNFTYYKELRETINEFNQFLLNDEELFSVIDKNLKESKNYNNFYNSCSNIFKLKKDNDFQNLIVNNIKSVYLNKIYRVKDNFSKESLKAIIENIDKELYNNKSIIANLTSFIENKLTKEYSDKFNKYVTNPQTYIEGNKLLTSNILSKIIYDKFVGKLFTLEKSAVSQMTLSFLKNKIEYKKLITSKKIIQKIATTHTSELEKIGLKKENATFIINTLLISGKYKLNTLEIGSSFMRIYDYIYVPLQATMFALLAFFVASASYRAFRARNKEATLLLVAGFVVMLGRVPVGEAFSIDGVLSFSQMSQFIMSVPAMSVQSGIMIGVALGVISTSLRLILGIERSHLGGD